MTAVERTASDKGWLELDRVSLCRGGRTLLDGISLTLGRQGRTVVMGPNGAGKSLLLRIAHGLLRPTSGHVRWHGGEAGQAMVFQRPVLLRRSALANIVYALGVNGVDSRERQDRARQALAVFGLEHVARSPARVLSGGEQQRLALARAWALRPAMLLLDEPTAALDPAASRQVEEAIARFEGEGIRIVLTTHDLGQARRVADEVVFLCNGRVEEQASAATFFFAPGSARAKAFVNGELVL